MSGPTREEVEAALRAWYGTTDPKVLAAWDNEVPEKDKQVRREWMATSLTAAEPLMRARHVREAVEGLKRSRMLDDALRRYDEERYAEAMGAAGATPALAWSGVIAALLAALTGEGK